MTDTDTDTENLWGIYKIHNDLRYCPISSGWHNVTWTLSHLDELAHGRISSGWLLDTAVCHPDDISYHHMSSWWLSRNWCLIRMSYDNVIMSAGWHTLPFLSHPDEIANFDFPHHAVALHRLRNGRGWAHRCVCVLWWCHAGENRIRFHRTIICCVVYFFAHSKENSKGRHYVGVLSSTKRRIILPALIHGHDSDRPP